MNNRKGTTLTGHKSNAAKAHKRIKAAVGKISAASHQPSDRTDATAQEIRISIPKRISPAADEEME